MMPKRTISAAECRTVFAKNLRYWREACGMYQSDLARESGVPSTAISHFECARRSPSLVNLRRLSDALEVSVDDLVY
jgi:transcriptional regulator with XRE-family HTH domain